MSEPVAPTSPWRLVPPSGPTAWITAATSGAMAFLAVFALSLALASARLAESWSAELAQSATVRISAPASRLVTDTEKVLDVLKTTPGIAAARVLSEAEVQELLAPWLGPDLPLASLALPVMIEVVEAGQGPDASALRLRLEGEVPDAVYDDHRDWRRPLISAAARLRILGVGISLLILGVLAAMVALAASAALSANRQVIETLRLVGATDTYVSRAFTRRFTLRGGGGALAGTLAGVATLILLPQSEDGSLLPSLTPQGWGWIIMVLVPIISALTAYFVTRLAARRLLRELP